MKNLEDLIKDNRVHLDGDEPLSGHLKRFERKMKPKIINLQTAMWYKVAAVIMAGLILAALLVQRNSESNEDLMFTRLPPDLQEALIYYQQLSDKSLVELHTVLHKDHELNVKLSRELDENDREYLGLLKEYGRFDGDERIINAIIENRRMKAEMLGFLCIQMADINYNPRWIETL